MQLIIFVISRLPPAHLPFASRVAPAHVVYTTGVKKMGIYHLGNNGTEKYARQRNRPNSCIKLIRCK